MALRISLRRAAGLRAHHRNVAAGAGAVAQALMQQRELGTVAAPLRNRARAREEGDAVIDVQRRRGDRLPVEFREVQSRIFDRGAGAAEIDHERCSVGHTPALSGGAAPQLAFIRPDATDVDGRRRIDAAIADGSAKTLEEVGKQFDVTRERIRQIEAKALRKLRHPTRSDKLRSFLDNNNS